MVRPTVHPPRGNAGLAVPTRSPRVHGRAHRSRHYTLGISDTVKDRGEHASPRFRERRRGTGEGHFIKAGGGGEKLVNVPLSGFTMIVSHPRGSTWHFSRSGDHDGKYKGVCLVPEHDPELETSLQGICGQRK